MRRTCASATGWWSRRVVVCGAVLVAAMFGLSAGAPRAWGQEEGKEKEKLPKGEEIVDKSVDAMGGKAAFEKTRTRVLKGTFEVVGQGYKGPITVYEAAPHKQYMLVEVEGLGKIESGTDGEVYWELTAMGGPRLLEGEEKALNVRQTTFNAPVYWRKLYKKVECVGTEDVDGRPCFKVEMTPHEGGAEMAYFDRKSYLLVKTALTLKSPLGTIPLEILVEDYKKVDGIMIPHKTTQKVMSIEQVVTIDSVEHNVDIPADRFALPEPIKVLVAKAKAETKPATTEPGKPKKDEPKKDKP